MPSRRAVLALMASFSSLPLAGPAAAFMAPAPAGPEIRRYGRFFIVNGWVLTEADLERLDLHAA